MSSRETFVYRTARMRPIRPRAIDLPRPTRPSRRRHQVFQNGARQWLLRVKLEPTTAAVQTGKEVGLSYILEVMPVLFGA